MSDRCFSFKSQRVSVSPQLNISPATEGAVYRVWLLRGGARVEKSVSQSKSGTRSPKPKSSTAGRDLPSVATALTGISLRSLKFSRQF